MSPMKAASSAAIVRRKRSMAVCGAVRQSRKCRRFGPAETVPRRGQFLEETMQGGDAKGKASAGSSSRRMTGSGVGMARSAQK